MEKKTFAQVVADAEANRHNSNLANLASGLNMLKEEEDRLKAQLENIAELRAEIETAGNNPDTLTFERTKELYGRCFGRKYDKA